VVRHGLAGLLDSQADLTCCGQASEPSEAVQAADRLRPHLLVTELAFPDANGLVELARVPAM
jgi:DNA-binding NarL/FixJ family response regulator